MIASSKVENLPGLSCVLAQEGRASHQLGAGEPEPLICAAPARKSSAANQPNMQCLAHSINLCNMTAMKIGFLAGANPHALAIARHFSSLGVDCFGIGRGPGKARPPHGRGNTWTP